MNANRQQSWTSLVFLLIVSALFSACSAVTAQDAITPPAFAATTLVAATSEPTLTASPTAPSSPTHRPAATASITALPAPSPEIEFPLAVNNTWIFKVTRYEGVPTTEIITTTLVVTETVVEVKSTSTALIAQIHRVEGAEAPVGEIPPGWQGVPLKSATSSDYWLVVGGNRVYRLDNQLDLVNLDEALLEFVFPLKVGDKWYQSDKKARLHPTPILGDFMVRQVTKVGDVVVPAGRFKNCFFMQEEWAGTTFETWFCPNVGIIDRKVDHQGTPEGFHEVLVKYRLNR